MAQRPFPTASNAAAPHTAGLLSEDKSQERLVETSEEDQRVMEEELGRDPAQMYTQHEDNKSRLQGRREEVQEAAPEVTLEDMATGQRTFEAGPRETAENTPVDVEKEKLKDVRYIHQKSEHTSKATVGYT